MKRRVIMALAACAVAAVFASCDSKLCYCYESTAQGVYEQEVYTNSDTPCNAMSNSRMHLFIPMIIFLYIYPITIVSIASIATILSSITTTAAGAGPRGSRG